MLNAGSFVTAGFGFAEKFVITAGDNYFLPLTMAHAIGALVAPAIAVATGGVLTLADRFSPGRFWQQVRESGATCSILFPAHLNLLLSAAQDSGDTPLRLIITHAWDERFATRFGVGLATVWGMTETGAMATGSTPGAARGARAGYVGTPMTGVEIGVFGPDGSRLPPGDVGEIRLRHEHVMLGYLNDPEETSRMLVGGWVCSGDEGVVEADGSVYFLGRKRHMIKRSGENISPDEVAEALLTHPAVIEALVFGVADDVRTEEVAAVLVVEQDARPEDILAVAGKRIAARKLPRYVAVTTAALPRLGNGKIDRKNVVEGFALESAWDRSCPLPSEAPATRLS
jgi:crotonobetaine/carnitine-CoA ligase